MLYSAALSAPGSTWDELRGGLGLPPEDFAAVAEHLLNLGLLERDPADENRLHAVAPVTAIARTCGPALRTLVEEQQRVGHLTSLIASYDAAYTAGGEAHGAAVLAERLTSLEAVRRAITELAARARAEILTSQPGGPRPEEQLEDSLERTENVLRRGVRMRTLYQQSAQFSQETTQYVRHLTELGAEVRTVSDGFMRLIVFDRTAAIMSLHDNPRGALVVRDSDIIDFAVGAYERAWAESRPFPVRYDRQQVMDASEGMKLTIMRLLVEGLEVTVIAKRLGVSHRTCQRHISEIMQRLGARNRLHAGFLIGRQGLLNGMPPDGHPSQRIDVSASTR
ncbi:LuxR C-terminal-related transcriptional regulator [Streptomyces sp. URMC 127]|uniref:LuxR C-terminal-related transcriptional regulator n=1 Tax=Streptomyces sp. URMC 127 TaxID=3423402 RepID=UPI003F1CB862